MTALPYILSAVPGLLSGAASIYQMAKGRGGGRINRKRVRRIRKGRGPVAQALGSIPLLGTLLGPLASAFGGKLRRKRLAYRKIRKAKGLEIDYYHPHFTSRSGQGMIKYGMIKYKKKKRVHRRKRTGGMLGPPGYQHGLLTKHFLGGLLAPAGGRSFRVKGHYRYTPSGKRVHVKAHVSGKGPKILSYPRVPPRLPPRPLMITGGYMPYRF